MQDKNYLNYRNQLEMLKFKILIIKIMNILTNYMSKLKVIIKIIKINLKKREFTTFIKMNN